MPRCLYPVASANFYPGLPALCFSASMIYYIARSVPARNHLIPGQSLYRLCIPIGRIAQVAQLRCSSCAKYRAAKQSVDNSSPWAHDAPMSRTSRKSRALARQPVKAPSNVVPIGGSGIRHGEQWLRHETASGMSQMDLVRIMQSFERLDNHAVGSTDGYRRVSLESSGKKHTPSSIDPPIGMPRLEWNADSIQQALNSHEMGMFQQSAMLADALMSDAKVSHAINLRGREFLKRKPYMTAPKRAQDQKLANRIAEEMQEVYSECVTPEVAELVMFRQPLMSFALFNVTWEEKGGLVLPEFRHYHESWTYYLQAAELEDRCLQAITMGGGPDNRPESRPIHDDDEDWFLFAPYGKYRGWIRAGVLQVAIPWMVRELSLRDWSRCSEVWGVPVKIIKVPASATEEDKSRLFAEANDMGSEVSFILPVAGDGSGFTVELLEPKQPKCWEIFSELGARCSSDIALALAGSQHLSQLGDQSAAGKSSSMASSKTSKSEEDDYGEQDAIRFAQAYRRGPLTRAVLYNYEVDDSYVPLLSLSSEEPENIAETCKAWFDLAQAMTLWNTMGAEVDLEMIVEETEAPLTGKMVAPPIPPAAPVAKVPADPAKPVAATDPMALGRGSMMILSVLIDPKALDDEGAKAWLQDHEFSTVGQGGEYPQRNLEDFAGDSLQYVTIAKGIRYRIGRLLKDTEGHVKAFERHARGHRHDQGLQYIDKLEVKSTSLAVAAMKPHLDNVQAAIASATTPEELERSLKRIARAVKYGRLEELVRNSRLMAHGAGRTVEVEADES